MQLSSIRRAIKKPKGSGSRLALNLASGNPPSVSARLSSFSLNQTLIKNARSLPAVQVLEILVDLSPTPIHVTAPRGFPAFKCVSVSVLAKNIYILFPLNGHWVRVRFTRYEHILEDTDGLLGKPYHSRIYNLVVLNFTNYQR